jgi:hypothetical protein
MLTPSARNRVLVLLATCAAAACTGDAPALQPAGGDAGAEGGAAGPDGARADATATEDTVSLRVGGRSLTFSGPASVHPVCTGGHKGVDAASGDDRFSLNAFVFAPGTYRCDQSLPYVFVHWSGAGGGALDISPVAAPGGSCEVVVASIRPRFVARFTASAPAGPDAGPVLALEGEIDVALPVAASCP